MNFGNPPQFLSIFDDQLCILVDIKHVFDRLNIFHPVTISSLQQLLMAQLRFDQMKNEFSRRIISYSIQLWDPRRQGFIFNYKGHNGAINALKFSPDGRYLITASDDTAIRVGEQGMIFERERDGLFRCGMSRLEKFSKLFRNIKDLSILLNIIQENCYLHQVVLIGKKILLNQWMNDYL